MTAAEILIKIRALFEKKPVEEAKKEVKELGREAKASGESGADGMNVLGTATAAMNGNVEGAVSGIGKMVASVKGLKVSILSLSLATAAVAALVKLFQALRDRAAEAAKRLMDIKAGNLRGELDSLTDAYGRMEAAMRRVEAERQAQNQYKDAMRQAYRDERMALLELAEAKALSAAKDEEERRRVQLEFEGRRRKAQGEGEEADARVRVDRLLADSRAAAAEARRLEEQNRELEDVVRRALGASMDATAFVRERSGFWSMLAHPGRADQYNEYARRQGETAASAVREMDANRARIEELRAREESLKGEAEAARIDVRTAGIRREAGDISHGTAVRDFERGVENRRAREAAEAEAEALERRYEELERRRDEAEFHGRARVDAERREWQASQGALRDARRTGDQGAWNSASARERSEKADYERASAELQGLVRDYQGQLRSLQEQIRSVREAARRIPNS